MTPRFSGKDIKFNFLKKRIYPSPGPETHTHIVSLRTDSDTHGFFRLFPNEMERIITIAINRIGAGQNALVIGF